MDVSVEENVRFVSAAALFETENPKISALALRIPRNAPSFKPPGVEIGASFVMFHCSRMLLSNAKAVMRTSPKLLPSKTE